MQTPNADETRRRYARRRAALLHACVLADAGLVADLHSVLALAACLLLFLAWRGYGLVSVSLGPAAAHGFADGLRNILGQAGGHVGGGLDGVLGHLGGHVLAHISVAVVLATSFMASAAMPWNCCLSAPHHRIGQSCRRLAWWQHLPRAGLTARVA